MKIDLKSILSWLPNLITFNEERSNRIILLKNYGTGKKTELKVSKALIGYRAFGFSGFLKKFCQHTLRMIKEINF